jgi:hypothetical protein
MLSDIICLNVSQTSPAFRPTKITTANPSGRLSKAWVCGRSLVGISGSNPAGVLFMSLVNGVCCQVEGSAKADPSSRGVLLNAVCLCVIWKLQQWGDLGPSRAVAPQEEKWY